MRIVRVFYPLFTGMLLIATLPLLLGIQLFARSNAGGFSNVDPAGPGVTITVTTANDELNSDGDCSLREAIQAANTDSAVDACPAGTVSDTVMVPAGLYTLSLAGANEDGNATGDLDILDEVKILGSGAGSTTIDGNNLDRIFHILGANVEVVGVTVVNGALTSGRGGAISNDGGTLLLRDSIVANSSASDCGGLANHAIGNGQASSTLQNVQVMGNAAVSTVSGIGFGGGICNIADSFGGTAMLTVTHSTVADNSAAGNLNASGMGGGVANAALTCSSCSAIAVIQTSAIRDNSGRLGGGVASSALQPTGAFTVRLTVDRTTVHGNVANGAADDYKGRGGGILVASGVTRITNSTISNNLATGPGATGTGKAGGLWVFGNYNEPAQVTISNTTIAENSAITEGGGVRVSDHGGSTRVVTFINTIVADNIAPISPNCSDPLNSNVSAGFNLEDGDSCSFDHAADFTLTDPQLGPLQDNGGPTETHAILPPSPAVDQGHCPDAGTDQRGVPRPFDFPAAANAADGCDIGAYEFELPPLDIFLPVLLKP